MSFSFWVLCRKNLLTSQTMQLFVGYDKSSVVFVEIEDGFRKALSYDSGSVGASDPNFVINIIVIAK